MLTRTLPICRQCLRPRLAIWQRIPMAGQIRTLKQKKQTTPPEFLPQHQKNTILGNDLHLDRLTGLLHLKDAEEARKLINSRLKAHKKGSLYQASIHGKAEMLREIMRMYDRYTLQRVYRETGLLRLIPSNNYYLARAYHILRDDRGSWETHQLNENLSPVSERYTRSKREKYSRWNSWSALNIKNPKLDASASSTRGEIVEKNYRRFCEKFTVTAGSAAAATWGSSTSKDLNSSNSDLNQTMDRETAQTGTAAASTAPLAAEPAEEGSEIWRPNQRDQELRQSTFSHPSQTTLAQATKQLRSSWSPTSFRDLNLFKALPEAIENITLSHLNKKDIKPTDIQSLAIPIITKLDTRGPGDSKSIDKDQFRSFLIAAETGSGKTLAYLIPLINRIKREEEWASQHPESPLSISNTHRAASPRAIIVVPTSELADQIYTILKKLSHEIKFTVCALLPKFDDATVRKSILSKYIDILISTPHRLNEFMSRGEIRADSVRYLIIDEADTIFDRSFTDSLYPILNSVKMQLTHLVLCTATIPVALEEKLHAKFGGMQRIVAPKIHMAPRRIDFSLVLESDKREGLLKTLRDIQMDGTQPTSDIKRAIIFCNARDGVREIYEFLKSSEDISRSEGKKGMFELIPFTRDNYDRHTAMERFNQFAQPEDTEKKLRILITTDMGSRGLDTLSAKTIVLYDVPYSSIDLLHRLGRTARAGTRGRAIMIVSKAEYRGRTKEWVNEIRDRLIRGEALV